MSLRFTPPPEDAKNLPRYASYVVGHGMKTHGGLGFAKNSWRNRGWEYAATDKILSQYPDGTNRYERKHVTRHAFLLENVDGLWYTLYEIKPGLTEEELPWMKEYVATGYSDVPYTDYHKGNNYYQDKIARGEYRVVKKATPMSRDEYVQWRLAIEREKNNA